MYNTEIKVLLGQGGVMYNIEIMVLGGKGRQYA